MRGIIVAWWILAVLAASACSRQEAGWSEATREDTVSAYQDYLVRFPAGAHAAEAETRILALREAGSWARAERLRTPEAWQRYLAEWPQGRRAEIARRRLVEFVPPPAPGAGADTGGFAVQLGAYSNEDAARAGLERLLRDHASELAALRLRVIDPPEGESAPWRLHGGPLPEADSREHCRTLRAAGIDCLAVGVGSAREPPP